MLFTLGAIWLFPFQLHGRDWILLAGVAVSYLCLLLIPPKAAAFAAAAAVSAGFSLYAGLYFAAFTPGLAACGVYLAASHSKAGVPIKKDAFLLTALITAGVCTAGSLLYTFSALRHIDFDLPEADRHLLFFAAAAAAGVLFFVLSLKKDEKKAAGRKKGTSPSKAGLVAAFAAMLAAFAAAGVFLLKQVADVSWCLFPVFLCVFTAAAFPEPVTAVLPGAGNSDADGISIDKKKRF